jgi:hypothetical protein
MPATINGTSGFGGNLTGNVTGNADTATTAGKFSTTSGDAPTYACRAWVNFNGDAGSTVDGEFRCTIRGSGNVSKVVRADTGLFFVTLTAAMPDANYAALCSIKAVDDTARHFDFVAVRADSSSVVRVAVSGPATPFAGVNAAIVMLSIFR